MTDSSSLVIVSTYRLPDRRSLDCPKLDQFLKEGPELIAPFVTGPKAALTAARRRRNPAAQRRP
jgi:hypothetical protein